MVFLTYGFFSWLHAKKRHFDNKCLRILPAGIYWERLLLIISCHVITVGIIRTRVLFEGGPYMRKYGTFPLKTMRKKLTELFMETNGGKLFIEINGRDINWGFHNELIKNHGGDIVRGFTFHAYHLPQFSTWTWKLCLPAYFFSQYWQR